MRLAVLVARLALAAILVLVLCPAVPAMQAADRLEGKTLEEALEQLQQRGLNVIYSSDLVRPDMKVTTEPPAGSLRETLERILAPYGLKVEDGPLNTLLVVYGSPDSRRHPEPDSLSVARSSSAFVVVPFVNISVTAQDGNDRYVTDLTASDFILKENGKAQYIVDFQNFSLVQPSQEDPLMILFLLDCSQSMSKDTQLEGVRRLDLIKDAASGLLAFFRPGDHFMAMGFTSRTWMIAEPTEDFEAIRSGIATQRSFFERTALYDALLNGLKTIQESYGRKIIILCSDGEDNISTSGIKDVLTALGSSAVTVYSISSSPLDPFAKQGADNLKKLTAASGGNSFFYTDASEVRAIMVDAGSAIRGQYSIGYYPANDNVRGWRRVEVLCKVPGVRLRYRKSYIF